jgi:uncharacterized protein (TIGR00369 family)
MPHVPSDPDFETRCRASFARQPMMATLGIDVQAVEPARVVFGLAHRPELTQQHGFLHAGAVATALDSACGYAAFTLMPADAGVLTIEYKVNLLAPARGPRFTVEGTVVKPGRTIVVAEGRAYEHAEDGSGRRLVATMTATLMTILGRDDVRG